MARKIEQPYWGNDDKTQVICRFVYDDGVVLEAAVMDTADGNPDWKEIMDTFTIEEIDTITQVVKERHGKVSTALIEQKLAEANMTDEEKAEIEAQRIAEEQTRVNRMKAEALFQAKLDAFEVQEVQSSSYTYLKSRIRKAKTIMEVQALTSALIIHELSAQGEIDIYEYMRNAPEEAQVAEEE